MHSLPSWKECQVMQALIAVESKTPGITMVQMSSLDQMKKGFKKDTEDALAGLRNVLN